MSLRNRWPAAAATVVLVLSLSACRDRSRGSIADEDPSEDDWWLPAWAVASTNAGFFEERLYDERIAARAVDLSWKQLMPTPSSFEPQAALDEIPSDYEGDEEAGYLPFTALDAQLAGDDPYWMRLFLSDVRLAPDWLTDECPGLVPIPLASYLGDEDLHYPIWDPCVWPHAREVYRRILLEQGLRSDPRLAFVYVPGAFSYVEFDFELIDASGVEVDDFLAWFDAAIDDLVEIMDGENADPSDDYHHKLVYTGEDYPFSERFGTADDLLALAAVEKGMGIRTGITELFNFHLNHVPAYGTVVDSAGRMATDETSAAFEPGKVRATENECFDDCGFHTDHPYYAVKMANLKALQLRMNWILPGAELLEERFQPLWNWVAVELGKTPADSPDAWVALRRAEDRSLSDVDPPPVEPWPDFPFVRNWERWLVQRDLAPDGLTRDGREVRRRVLAPENGVAVEGRATIHDEGSDYLYFDVDDRFLFDRTARVALFVTFFDEGEATFEVEYAAAGGSGAKPVATKTDTGRWKTASVEIDDAIFDGSLAGGHDFRLYGGGEEDLEVRFVRLVKLDGP